MKTIVPREVLHAWMRRNMQRPNTVCTFCGGAPPLREMHITFTRDYHSEIDGDYDVRACNRCQKIMAAHPSFMARREGKAD